MIAPIFQIQTHHVSIPEGNIYILLNILTKKLVLNSWSTHLLSHLHKSIENNF